MLSDARAGSRLTRRDAQERPEQERYRQQRKQHNLSQQAVHLLIGLRASLDQAGAQTKSLLMAGDGSCCHRTLFRTPLDRIYLPVPWMEQCIVQRLAIDPLRLAGSQLGFVADPMRFVDALTA